MINLPTPLVKFGRRALNWTVQHGPQIMSISGGAMAIGGAVMACNATLRADEVLDAHKARMAQIEAARALSLESDNLDPENVYTEKDMKRDKFITYAETAVGFVKLYGPAFAVGMSGVGLMQAAYAITETRRASAVGALTSLKTMFDEYKVRVEDKFGPEALDIDREVPTVKRTVKTIMNDEPEEQDVVVLDGSHNDPFFFLFDETNPNWAENVTYLLNERFLTGTIDALNYSLSAHSRDHVWVNDILKLWGMKETDLGHFHGWNANTGDVIEYELVPYLKAYYDDDGHEYDQFPMLVETTMENLRELELADIQQGYAIGIRLLSSSDGHDGLVEPRMIYNEVYGC